MRSRPRGRSVAAALCGAVLLMAVLAVVVVGALTGARCFVIESASMGRAVPVGTLVVSVPTAREPRAGDVITVRVPGSGLVVTHRVVAAGPGGIRTRGDLNAAPDPWTLRRADVIGSALLVVPGLGFAVRCLPLLLVSGVVAWLATLPIRRADLRTGVRMLLGAVSVAVATAVVHPFLSVAVLGAGRDDAGRLVARVVSTGLFPVRISPGTGQGLHLVNGQAGQIVLPSDSAGAVRLTTTVDLDPMQTAVVVAVCLAPTVVSWLLTVRGSHAGAVA